MEVTERKSASLGYVREVEDGFDDWNMREVIEGVAGKGFEFVAYFVGGEERARMDPKKNKTLTKDNIPLITVVDLQLQSADWARWIVGRFSPWIDLDSKDDRIREMSEVAFDQEINYMRYLGLSAILIDLKRLESANLARVLGDRLWTCHGYAMQVWISVPLTCYHRKLVPHIPFPTDPVPRNGVTNEEKVQIVEEDTWLWWYRFRTRLGNHRKISMCLKFTMEVSGEDIDDQMHILRRWLGEPISAVWVKSSCFVINEKGFPVLPKMHQNLLKSLFNLKCQAIFSMAHNNRSDGSNKMGIENYVAYLNYMWDNKPPVDSIAHFSSGYEDHVQIPLQPLSDNLESATYEVFEKDPVKYKLYQDAILIALKDVCNMRKASGEDQDRSKKIIVMVLGAGRGPLVTASRAAVEAAGLVGRVRIFAVEKNPNSAVTIRYLNQKQWNNEVTVVNTDMRNFKPDEKVDIAVSELLGSFGDNELSPECLDGALHLMKSTCINIPQEYTSYLAPLHSPRIYSTIRDDLAGHSVSVTGKGLSNGSRPSNVSELLTSDGVSDIFDLPYVVRLHNRYEIAPPKPVFTFKHPNWEKSSNSRHVKVSFGAKESCELVGLAGYFDCVLYKDVRMGIHPLKHTDKMFSWFPILFPLARPVFVKSGEEIALEMWRLTEKSQVWYEWCLQSPAQLRIQNTGGKAYAMGLPAQDPPTSK